MRKIDEASKTLFVGSVVADSILFARPELAAHLDLDSIEPLPTEYVGQARQVVLGVLLVLLMLFRPQGLVGKFRL